MTFEEALPLVQSPTPGGPPDELRWAAWLDSLLDAGAARIAAAQREMRARGILDDAGNLATSALPTDMRAVRGPA